jgi:L-ascorbate metabolism protein UlaG (beta-lactamase superfamily)
MRTLGSPSATAGILLASVLFFFGGCTSPAEVTVHYLGHSSFVLQFGGGTTVLTDYGESNAYGLDSPILGLGGLVPDILTLSHDHPDHVGGAVPEGIETTLAGGSAFQAKGLTVTPIPTYENSLTRPDNFSFLFEYRGLKILHLGDCQSMILGFSKGMLGPEGSHLSSEELGKLIRDTYPDSYDLVLMPIGFTQDILPAAAAFAGFLDARVIVPMHYWNTGERDAFLARMGDRRDEMDRPYRSRLSDGPKLLVTSSEGSTVEPEVVGLIPEGWTTRQ